MNTEIKVVYKKLEEITPYVNNPRINEVSVDAVANSIKEFGFKVPIVIDKDGIIVTGHTRYKASKKLGLKEVPTILADDLTEEQVKAYRIADNKVGENSEWDLTKLKVELDDIKDINMEDFNMLIEDLDKVSTKGITTSTKENKYTTKVDIPQYEITGENPEFSEMYDTTKYDELVAEIEKANLPQDEKEFLLKAATRHIVFDYANIAEHYAHSDKTVQELMEASALVIIDFDDALKNGYIKLDKNIKDLIDLNEDDDDEE